MDLDPDHDRDDAIVSTPSSGLQSASPIDATNVQDYLKLFPYASEHSYFTRANRYRGPPSTWYSWTADDRAVADALDASRAKDLSRHLYNAFVLKARNRQVLRDNGTDNSPDSTQDTQADPRSFMVPETWTAWPLQAGNVPRELGLFGDPTQMSTIERASEPSATLADALLAVTLRHAKGQWRDRKEEEASPLVELVRRDWKRERENTKKELLDLDDLQDSPNEDTHEAPDPDQMSESEAGSNVSDEDGINESLPEGMQFFSSQAFKASESDSSTNDESPKYASEDDLPAFSADDDHARRILMPSVRHILTKADDLLMGLHKARFACTVRNTSSRSRSRSIPQDTERTDNEPSPQSRGRAISVRPFRKRKRSPSDPSLAEEARNSRSRGRSELRQSGKKGLGHGLRDWSDVLGMATITGWNTETVARAAARCAKLFEQNMTFRTFHQGSQGQPWFEEESAYVPEVFHDPVETSVQNTLSNAVFESKGAVRYTRTSAACSRCKSLKQRCDPPMLIVGPQSARLVACAGCASLPELNEACSGIEIQVSFDQSPTPTSKRCPYPDCPRHSSQTKPFQKFYHLQRHLKDVHGHLYTPPHSISPNDKLPNSASEEFELTLRARVKSAEVKMCPVPSCPNSTHVYKRSTRLYNHIKKEHPEIDVASLKKFGARTSTRGKYDRSRSRSRVRESNFQPQDQQHDEIESQQSNEPQEQNHFADEQNNAVQ